MLCFLLRISHYFYLYGKEVRIGNYTAITISSYMHFLKLLLNYLSEHKIQKFPAKSLYKKVKYN